jgi:23S rRNA (adenine2503-C2)-methyltransferase
VTDAIATASGPTGNPAKVNLLDFDREGLRDFFARIGEKPYRAEQVMKWMYHNLEDDFEAMTDLGKALRAKLADTCYVGRPNTLVDKAAADGTHKWLLGMDTGNAVETVYIPEPTRGTLCVSSQIGCALNCQFCSTGAQGFNRNLSTAEIIGQVWVAAKYLGNVTHQHRRITNVVMMGMGEPLANFDNVVAAMKLMRDDLGFGLASKRVTLSTAGMVPWIDKLSDAIDVSLAVSLHAATDELRTELMPINKRYPLAELVAACQRWIARKPRTSITFEYTLMKGVNDQPEHAKQLIRFMRKLPTCKVNLIPFNPFPGTKFQRSDAQVIHAFQTQLLNAGILTMLRRTRGDDIDAACGQLAGQVTDRTRRSAEIRKRVNQEATHAQ